MIKTTDIKLKLAVLQQANGNYEPAMAGYLQFLREKPQDPIINYLVGTIYFQFNDLNNSKKFFDNAIKFEPNFSEALNLRGIIYKEWKKLELAENDFNNAILIRKNFPEALSNLADLYRLKNNFTEARSLINQAIKHNPNLAAAYNNLGVIERDTENLNRARTAFEKALTLDPALHQTELNLALVIDKIGDTASAIELVMKVIINHPQNAHAHNCLGTIYLNQNNLSEAEKSFKKSCSLEPAFAEANNNLANTLLKKNKVKLALKYFNIALDIDPKNPGFWANKGAAYQAANQLQKAIGACNEALNINPNHTDGRWNRGIAYLLSGDLLRGFSDYETRWQLPEFKSLKRSSILWTGQNLFNKSILVYSEQGFGDTIQFVRYINKLTQLEPNLVYFETHSALETLINEIDGIDMVFTRGAALPRTDFHIPLMSLPFIFKTTIHSIPNQVPYLHPPQIPPNIFTKNNSKKFNVGICWKGRVTHKNDSNRSICVKTLFPLFEMPDIQFYNLQLDHGESKILKEYKIIDLSNQITDFSSTAAMIKGLDLVITVDTALAHLSGALDFECWVLLPFSPDWRWLLKTSSSPWYPSLKLFRQQTTGDWSKLISIIRQSLKKKFALNVI